MAEGIAIIERYRSYVPPVDIAPSVRVLLRYVPEPYLAGLRSVVLTNSTSSRWLRRGKTLSRGNRVRMSECAGFYSDRRIELLVDNLLAGFPNWFIRWPITRNLVVGRTLYHEIGHHIHLTQQPKYREEEDEADDWADRLMTVFIRRHYWYLRPLLKPIGWCIKAWKRNVSSRSRLQTGSPAAT